MNVVLGISFVLVRKVAALVVVVAVGELVKDVVVVAAVAVVEVEVEIVPLRHWYDRCHCV